MIVHFTTVHPRTDTRIRVKEVATLARHLDEDVQLFVQDGLGDEVDPKDGFLIIDTGPRLKGRLARMTLGAWRMYRAVRCAHPSIAHFHDPELLPWGLLLRVEGIRVVYDVHEDLPRQIHHKIYIPRFLRSVLGSLIGWMEALAARGVCARVVVIPEQLPRFPARNTVLVANFPKLDEFPKPSSQFANDTPLTFVYVGGISIARGALQMVHAAGEIREQGASVSLLGPFTTPGLESRLSSMPAWDHVDYQGVASREQVTKALSDSYAGLVLLHPSPQYKTAYPVKLFEYMASGLPVIASDLPLMRKIVNEHRCGLLVDPIDLGAIVESMKWLLAHPEEARAMGLRGRLAVETMYNWKPEAAKLLALYRQLLRSQASDLA